MGDTKKKAKHLISMLTLSLIGNQSQRQAANDPREDFIQARPSGRANGPEAQSDRRNAQRVFAAIGGRRLRQTRTGNVGRQSWVSQTEKAGETKRLDTGNECHNPAAASDFATAKTAVTPLGFMALLRGSDVLKLFSAKCRFVVL
jgi:hypothetical protein